MAHFAPRPLTLLILNALAVMTLAGCASDDTLRQEVSALSARLDELRSRLSVATSRMEGDAKRLDKVETDLTTTSKRVADTAASPEQAHARIDDLIQDFGKACFRIGENKQAITQAHQRIDDILATLSATQERVKASEQRMDGAMTDLSGARDRLAALESGATASIALPAEKGVVLRPAPAMHVEPVVLPIAMEPVASTSAPTGEPSHATAPAQTPVAPSDTSTLTASAAPVAATLADLPARVDETRQRQDAQANTLAALQQRLVAVEGSLAEKSVAGGDARPITAADLADVNRRIADLHSQAGGANERLTGQAAALEKRLVAVEGSLVEKPATTGDARPVTFGELADVNRQIADLRAQTAGSNERLAGHDATLDSAAKRIDSLERLLASLATPSGTTVPASHDGAKRGEGDATRLIADLHANLATLDKRVTHLEGGQSTDAERLADLDRADKAIQSRLSVVENGLAGVSATAKEALDRAVAAGKLAEGKLLLETVLTDDIAQFAFDKATLSKAAKDELKAFADKLKAENKNVYIEIQGHTDNIGGARKNLELGQARADAVMAYLHTEAGLPLHRMDAVSYGETRPVGDNKTKAGRALNRRVALIVLK